MEPTTYDTVSDYEILEGEAFYHLQVGGINLVNSKRNGVYAGWILGSSPDDGPFKVLHTVEG